MELGLEGSLLLGTISAKRTVRRVIGAVVCALLATAVLGIGTSPVGAGGWPGQNGKIAFKSGNDEIWVMNPDGSGKTQLTDGTVDPCGGGDEEPSWSADGSKIVFTSSRTGVQEVWVMNADGSNQTQLTTTADSGCEDAFSENPSWSPDGSKIIFTRNADPNVRNEDLWIMNADGSNPQKFYGDADHEESEAFFSPDGSKIVFQVEPHEDCGGEMWTMNPDGTGAQKLLESQPECSYDENYTWSPDSTKIAFTRSGGGTGCSDEVWVVDVATKVATQLTDCIEDTQSEHPAWSPDGTKIVFANSSNDDSIWIMNADGSNPQMVPQDALVDNGQPDWQPIVPPPTPPETAPEVVLVPTFTG